MAVAHKGSDAAVEALMPEGRTAEEIAALGDDRLLAEMAKRIFQSGFVWKVVEAKWPGFEKAFDGFHVGRVASLNDEEIEQLLSNKEIIRNGQKIVAVVKKAQFLMELAGEHGSAAKFIADWPGEDIVGLWALLKKRGTRLGGNTGQYFLRFIGKDTFILSQDVVRALIRESVIEKEPTSQKALAAVQDAFNGWQRESGLPLAHISRLLSLSVG
ncbi:DNA-3-methyladenine glycosylase I [Aestuariispira insulae]|uniref:DNA-3-methyladenine glycosylase I n=2 Tax=Aestuariispira insulae TaxID=1461337 RepID=A0A3D9HY78_9PROT|nr:DNA-3-methyladenine glycosylase I [Aestuariispira insulae]